MNCEKHFPIIQASDAKYQIFWMQGPLYNASRIRDVLQMPMTEFLGYIIPKKFITNTHVWQDVEDSIISTLNRAFGKLHLPLECYKKINEKGLTEIQIGSNHPGSKRVTLSFFTATAESGFPGIENAECENFHIDKNVPVNALVNSYTVLTENLQEYLNTRLKLMAQTNPSARTGDYLERIDELKKDLFHIESQLISLSIYENAPCIYPGDVINIGDETNPLPRVVHKVQLTPDNIHICFETQGNEFPFVDLDKCIKYDSALILEEREEY